MMPAGPAGVGTDGDGGAAIEVFRMSLHALPPLSLSYPTDTPHFLPCHLVLGTCRRYDAVLHERELAELLLHDISLTFFLWV